MLELQRAAHLPMFRVIPSLRLFCSPPKATLKAFREARFDRPDTNAGGRPRLQGKTIEGVD
eukprot:5744805-Pyramimonas_sp.AAC.1